VFDFKLSDRTLPIESKKDVSNDASQSAVSFSQLNSSVQPATEYNSGIPLGNYVNVDFGLNSQNA